MASPIQQNLQYAIFCTEFVEDNGHVSILGVLDSVDVRGTIRRGLPVPRKVYPLKLVLGINAPPGTHQLKLGIASPSGGIMTTVDLGGLSIPPGETFHRCIANLDMEVPKDGLYTFHIFLDGREIGGAVLRMAFAVEYV